MSEGEIMAFRKNVSDKEQADLERALSYSSIRFHKAGINNVGETVFIEAYGNGDADSTYAKQSGLKIASTNDTFANSRARYTGIIGDYSDNPSVFLSDTTGKAII